MNFKSSKKNKIIKKNFKIYNKKTNEIILPKIQTNKLKMRFICRNRCFYLCISKNRFK